MRSSSKRFGAIAAVVAVTAVLSGCAGSSSRPPATEVVQKYLEAVAAGDAATAASMDPSTVTSDEDGDAEVLRTDAVLGGAEERITDIAVDTETRSDGDGPDNQRVMFSYTLGGDTVESSLAVTWSDGEWHLAESIAGRLFVQVSTGPVDAEIVGYEVPGATVVVDDPPRLFQWAYPAVYDVSVDVDPALLASSDDTSRRVAVEPAKDVEVDVPVTQLPTTQASAGGEAP